MSVNDRLMKALEEYGGKTVNERIYHFLGSLGFTNSLSDRLAEYESGRYRGYRALIEDLGRGSQPWEDLYAEGQSLHFDYLAQRYGIKSLIDGSVTYTTNVNDLGMVARASSATYWGPSRTLLEASVDEARIQHDPVTGEPLGVLIEPSRTNLLTNSLRPMERGWSDRWVVTPIQNIDGTMTAVRAEMLRPSTVTARVAYPGTGGGLTITQITRPTLQDGVRNPGISGLLRNFSQEINGGAGVYEIATGAASGSCVSGRHLGDGWYETVFVYPGESLPGPPVSGDELGWYINGTSTATGSVREIAGVQIESGTKATSFIPTSDSPATRAADNVSIDLFDVLNPVEGTLRITAQVPEGEVVASLGDLQVVSDSDEKKTYRMTYSDYTGVPTVTLGNGIHSKLEYFPEAQS